MRRLLVIIVLLALSLISCTKKTTYPNLNRMLERKFSEVEVLYTSDKADSLGAEVSLKAIFLPEDEQYPILAEINKIIRQHAYNNDNGTTEYFTDFEDEYRQFKSDFPDSAQIWSLKRYCGFSGWTYSTVTLITQEESYTGGAHSNSIVTLQVLDLLDGHQLSLNDVILKLSDFNDVAIRYFYSTRGISPDTNLSDAGFFQDTGVFRPAENFSISNDFVTMYYNTNEIAAYSEGPTVVRIPLEACMPYLQDRFTLVSK